MKSIKGNTKFVIPYEYLAKVFCRRADKILDDFSDFGDITKILMTCYMDDYYDVLGKFAVILYHDENIQLMNSQFPFIFYNRHINDAFCFVKQKLVKVIIQYQHKKELLIHITNRYAHPSLEELGRVLIPLTEIFNLPYFVLHQKE